MKILSIDIKNFRLHADTSINFQATGITGIVGSNESGKSTILEALLWAFFGGDATRGTKEGVRWFRAPERHPAAVLVIFELKGTEYLVDRNETGAKVCQSSPTGPVVLAEGTAPVNKFIPELLGMSHNEFAASFMVKQKDVDRIASMLPTDRTTFIREVLGVGKLDEALKACRKVKNEMARELDGMKHGLGSRAIYDSALTTAHEELGEAGKAAKHAREALKGAKTINAVADASFKLENKRGLEDARLQQDIEAAWSVGNTAAEARVRIQSRLDAVEAATETLAQFPDGSGLEAVIEKQEELTTAVFDARTAYNRLIQLREANKGRLASNAHRIANEAEAAGKALRAILTLGDESPCPVCTVALGTNFDLVSKAMTEAHTALVDERDKVFAERDALNTSSEDEVAAQVAEAEALRDLEAHAKVLAEAKDDEKTIGELRALISNEEENRKELAIQDEILKDAGAKGLVCEDLRKENGYDEKVYARVQADAGDAAAALQEALVAEAKADAAIVAAESRIKAIDTDLVSWASRATAVDALAEKQLHHEKAAARLADFRTSVAGTIRPELEELMSGFVHILTDGRHEAVELTEDFQAVLQESGIAVEVVSGGCEDIAALAMRLSISQMIAERAGHPLSLLILDEPFGSQDEDRRANILRLLEQLKDIFTQVIVISHIAETRDAADHIVELHYDEFAGKALVVA